MFSPIFPVDYVEYGANVSNCSRRTHHTHRTHHTTNHTHTHRTHHHGEHYTESRALWEGRRERECTRVRLCGCDREYFKNLKLQSPKPNCEGSCNLSQLDTLLCDLEYHVSVMKRRAEDLANDIFAGVKCEGGDRGGYQGRRPSSRTRANSRSSARTRSSRASGLSSRALSSFYKRRKSAGLLKGTTGLPCARKPLVRNARCTVAWCNCGQSRDKCTACCQL